MAHNARVLSLTTDAEIIAEMERVNAEEAGIMHMLPKSRHYLVKLEAVRRPIAHILKETFLSNGGDALVSRDIITAKVDRTDVILTGTRKHYQRALLALREQGFGCSELAIEVEAAIRHFDNTPTLPSSQPTVINALYQTIGHRTLVMGILNVTPDSFSDGGKYKSQDDAIESALKMVEDGADIIDVGGQSTRPGAEEVSIAEEIDRVAPIIQQITKSIDKPVSIDTYRAEVARNALAVGASIINDISAATFDPEMPELLAQSQCPAILMHILGTPKNMQIDPRYNDLMGEIVGWLRGRIKALVEAGVDEKLLIVDPGIGFGKTPDHNLEILRRLAELKSLGRPIMVGTSRKATIGKVLGGLPATDRIEGTAATVALSIANGADIVRVHDVKEMARVAKMTDAVLRGL
ncbi:MAG: dihydropteroate synthase [Armatimonadota bacterium]|jgi:dihydropteroate synthase